MQPSRPQARPSILCLYDVVFMHLCATVNNISPSRFCFFEFFPSHIDNELFIVQQLLAQGWGNWGVDARRRRLTAGKFFTVTTDGRGLRNLEIIHIPIGPFQ